MSSAKLAVLGLLFPLAIALLTVVFWSVRSIVAKKCFLHRGIASLLVVLYVFYLGAAKRAFSIFHLVQVEGIPDASDGSIEPNRFWAEDTSYEYFQGSHLVLVFLSLAFVVTWILAFPIGLLIFLMLNPESLEEHSFSERYGIVLALGLPVYLQTSRPLSMNCAYDEKVLEWKYVRIHVFVLASHSF